MNYKYNTFKDFKEALKTDATLQTAFQNDPQATMDQIKIVGLPNTRVYRLIVMSLLLTLLLIVIGMIVMVVTDKAESSPTILTIFTSIASTAIGALAGVLMPAQKES